MSLNATPRGDRIHIALFGKRNAGKSSVINAMTNQELAIVSDVKGTTTDPVYKAMELLPLGPVVMIDTPGLDDEGELGEKRVKKAKEVLGKADIALVIMDATAGMTEFEECLRTTTRRPLSTAVRWSRLSPARMTSSPQQASASTMPRKATPISLHWITPPRMAVTMPKVISTTVWANKAERK